MNYRTISAVVIASALVFTLGGCKKKTPAPPPPPSVPVEKPKPAPPSSRPEIATFSAEPSTIERGQCATLRWNVSNASEITISQGVGTVQASGNRAVCPSNTTTYTIVARSPGGEASSSATVNVTSPPPPPPPVPTRPSISLSDRLARDVQDAFFDYDKSEIREDARAALSRNSDALKAIFNDFPNAMISVEGHCDERGSAEYNLGLGDRRSTAAKEFLTQLGVPADRLRAVSYGKERPQCADATEDCYQKNRRVHFSGQ
jgi:peptidoglycan-associated lipoprotein